MGKDRQMNSWGYIDWIQREPSGGGFPASIGFVNLLPGKRQAEHTHHSEAQFLYTITGYGEHIINGKRYQFGPGDHFLMDSGVVHATINRGEEVMQELIVSIPIHLCRDVAPVQDGSSFDPDFAQAALLDGIGQLARDTLDHVNMPVVLAGGSQDIIYCKGLPPLCRRCEEPACPLRRSVHELHSDHCAACSSVVCPRGLTVLVQPVMLDNRACGFIKGGLFRQYPNIPAAGEVYDVPDSTVNAARFFLQDISSYLAAFYQERKRQRPPLPGLPAGEAAGIVEQLRTHTLNIQIRNHLLFNTLNSIASLAIRDGSMDTYRAIIDLAELLRGLLRREGARVPLSEEIAFLQRYINLQTLRFEDGLQVTWRRCAAAERTFVPHNFLQPIVENALLHGYNGHDRRELLIETALEEGRSVVRVQDNGCGMDAQTLERLRSSLYSGAAHGLSMVNRKLAGVFGQDFHFDIASRPGEGTCCRLSFPI